MKLFVFEHLCGGGETGRELPAELTACGGAMLWAVAEDFARLGHDVASCVDARLNLPMQNVGVTYADSSSATMAAFDRLSAEADRTLVIAPEIDGLLADWLRRLDESGRATVNCDWRTAALCGDKLALAEHLVRHGIPTPRTKAFHLGDAIRLPAVIKPRRSAGCERTYIIYSMKGLEKAASLELGADLIVQDYVAGVPGSCAVIADAPHVRPLLPGLQFIGVSSAESAGGRPAKPPLDLPHQLFYEGGSIPLPDDLARRAAHLARRAVGTLPGARGYLGVDLALGVNAAEDCVIEINPRLSMSYLGLRALCQTNLGAALLDANAPVQWSSGTVSFDIAGRVTRKASA